jgi:hypothetical protein
MRNPNGTVMKRFAVIISTLLLLVSCANGVQVADEGLESFVTTTYQASNENFPNPERGLHTTSNPPWEYRFDKTERGWTPALDLATLENARAQGITLHAMHYTLRQFQTSDLSAAFLKRVETDLITARQAGFKIILRFMYSVGYYGETMPGGTDATSSWMVRHLEQLKPIFTKNADVIAGMDAGFVGVWGEWHTSSNGLLSGPYKEDINSESRKVLDKIFEVLPAERMIRFRYPRQKSQYFHPDFTTQTGEDAWFDFTPMPQESAAFSKSKEARAGNHNDGFLTSEHDSTTYGYDGNSELVQNLKERTRQENLYVFQGGELDFGLGESEQRALCPEAVAEFKKMRWSTLNFVDGSNSNSFIDAWKQGGCYTTIARSLGYRFRLTQSNIPTQVKPGNTFSMTFTIANVGWASLYNSRLVEINLQNKATDDVFTLRLPGTRSLNQDPRFWQPSKTYTVTVTGGIPSTMPQGDYSVG